MAGVAEPSGFSPLLEEASVRGTRILVVDDVSYSGHARALVVSFFRDMSAEVRTVTLSFALDSCTVIRSAAG
ncbi:hypothetical protein [Rathayibacter toxicus]|uniref:hypothetical protein n=1 Tax=Rathayibacter toxicus TaxID=145458 RepID=UPI000CE7B01A|nr:hypothetical protein [Rathayibacter toxicus]PPI54310.1 hypothetical protein C5D35_08355 [Rathayibacter toxicus]QOD10983.1 hypothetical protein BSG36_03200 [Rathayibacter toxicus]QWL27728.1 hypothetical protein E2R33_03205 [Rathayibacter toxicus]